MDISPQVGQDDEDCEGGGQEEHAGRVADLLQESGGFGVAARPEDGGGLAATLDIICSHRKDIILQIHAEVRTPLSFTCIANDSPQLDT